MASDVQDVANSRRRVVLTIPISASITSGVDLLGYRVAAIDWNVGASANVAMTFQGSMDNTSYYNLFDSSGTEITIASGAFSTVTARAAVLDPTLALQLMSHRYIKFRTGTAGAPSSGWTSAPSFDVVLMPT